MHPEQASKLQVTNKIREIIPSAGGLSARTLKIQFEFIPDLLLDLCFWLEFVVDFSEILTPNGGGACVLLRDVSNPRDTKCAESAPESVPKTR